LIRQGPFPVLVGLVVALTGCGVPAEDEPRSVEPPRGVQRVTASPAPTVAQPGIFVERLYYLRGDQLVPVVRQLQVELTAQAHLDLLLAGPTDAEEAAGLTSAVTGSNAVTGLRVGDGAAEIDIGDGLAGTGRNDEILAFGQIVLTITTRPDVRQVTFVHNGESIGIPRADGSLSRSALTKSDYAALISN
jgi:spore germination protein GerM